MKKNAYYSLLFFCSALTLSFNSFSEDKLPPLAHAQDRSLSPFISFMFGKQSYQTREKTRWSGSSNGKTDYLYGAEGFSSELALGMNKKFANNANLGAMIFVNGSPIDYELTSHSSTALDNYRITHTIKNTWGIRILPGYYLNQDSLIYIPLGWAHSQFKLNSSAMNNVASANKDLNGLQVGVGIDQAINDQLHLKVEYLNTQYEHFTIPYSGNNLSKKRHYLLSSDQFNVGLAYYFDAASHKPQTKACLPSGWYLGAGSGKSVQNSQLHIRDTDLDQKQYPNGTGILGLLFMGYGHTFPSRFYLAGEASTFFDDAQHRQANNLDDNAPFVRESQMKYGYSLSLMPGYQVASNFRLFGKVGFTQGRYYYGTALGNTKTSQTKMLSGALFGFGSELAMNSQWSLRAEYQKAWYKALNEYIGTTKETVKPTTGYYLLSIVYHF